MRKKIVKNFLKDRIFLISFYILNMASVITFFHVSEPANTEFMYPLLIGLFLLTLYLLIDGARYYQTNRSIGLMLTNEASQFPFFTEEQRAFHQLLIKIMEEESRKSNELKEQNKERLYFLSHWMHELKTPVSVIELILQQEKGNPVYEQISQENRRLHHSIEQGLTMIRMESFENDLEPKSIDLLSSLRKVINRRKKEFIYQSIFPEIISEDSEVYVVTDPKWNDVMIEQLISNGIKYSSKTPGSKKLIFQIEGNDLHTTLSIIDEGVGIPPYDLEQLFQPFFTGENGREFTHSTGIGLYLCKKIADKLGQRISIDSAPSRGTTVNIQYVTGHSRKLTKM